MPSQTLTRVTPPAAHPLDNVVWQALASHQAPLRRGDALACRFDPDFAVFGALAENTPAAFASLARLVPAGEQVVLLDPTDLEPGDAFEVLGRGDLLQMSGALRGAPADPARFEVLGPDDAPAMRALVAQTQPGPFFARTHELGRFVGLKVDGRLVAMAGERMHVGGHTEISAVCTDPAWRGRGLAKALMQIVSQAIVARGETPFLHVYASNTSAIALYEALGMSLRARLRLVFLQPRDTRSAA